MEGAILYKHSQAVHAAAELSLIERKVINCLLYVALNNQADNEIHRINVSELLKMMNIKTRNYTSIYLAIKKLACTLIEWGVLKVNSFKGNLTGVTLLEMYNITDGTISFRISKELNELLISPNQYATIRMSSVMAMSSAYGVALYENCAGYLGWGNTGWIDIGTFRKLMGIGEKKYSEYRDLKSRVIKPAVEDINKNAEFNVELEEKKEAGSTAKIKFMILNNALKKAPVLSEKDLAVKELSELGVPKSKINFWVQNHGSGYIQKKIEYVLSSKNVKNKTGFLIASVEKDYVTKDKIRNIQLQEKQLLEDEFFRVNSQKISNWFDVLEGDDWLEICNHLFHMTKNQPVLHSELQDRLVNKSFRAHSYTNKDVLQISERLIRSNTKSLSHLNPPILPTWEEFLGGLDRSV